MIVFVTSHRAHLYGQMEQLPDYEPIAESKHADEQALRTRQDEFAGRGVRLIVMTGSLIEGTIAPKLLELTVPGLFDQQRTITGTLLTVAEMGREIALAAIKTDLPNSSTVVVGAPLQSRLFHR